MTAPARPGPVASARAGASPGVAGVLAAGAVLAGAMAVDPWGLRPFGPLRWTLVGTLVAGGVLVAPGATAALPRWARVAAATIVGSMALSATTVALDPASAWLGHGRRHLGVLAWVVFALAGVLGARLATRRADLVLLSLAAWSAAAITALSAMVDLWWWSPFGTTFADGRVGGLLGQPTTLGALAVLLAPLAVVAPVPKSARTAVGVGLVATVLATQTRGALLGLAAAGVASLPALPGLRSWVRRRPVSALAAVVVAGAALLASPVGARLLDSASSGRVDDWSLAVAVIADHPALGVGPEGFRIAATAGIDDRYVAAHGRDVVVDRAHASPLDVAATGGVAAGGAYVVLLGGVAAATWRAQRHAPWSLIAAAGAGATGCLTAGLVAFPVPEVDALAWLAAGVVVAGSPPGWRGRPRAPGRGRGRGGDLVRVVAAVVLVVAATAGARHLVADRALGRADDHAAAGRLGAARVAADQATALAPADLDAWYVAAGIAAGGPTILDLDAGLARVRDGLARSPRDPALRDLELELLAERADRSDLPADRTALRAAASQRLIDDPTNPLARERLDVDGTAATARGCLSRCNPEP